MAFNIKRWLPYLLGSALLVALVLVLRAPRASSSAPAESGTKTEWQHVVAILQYLASDYPAAVASADRGELEEQESLIAEALTLTDHLGDEAAPFADRLKAIDQRVRDGKDADGVRADCLSLVEELVSAQGIVRAPHGVPDLDRGAGLFSQHCTRCHGSAGRGDGPLAAGMDPLPANFHDPERVGPMTPFKVFNTLRFGVRGTRMASFADLVDEEDRWTLAFYVFTLRQPECDHPAAPRSIAELANTSDDDLVASAGASELACLRRRLPQLQVSAQLTMARDAVASAITKFDAGDLPGAQQAMLDGYLEGVEPIEPALRAKDPDLVKAIEAGFTRVRASMAGRDVHATVEAGDLVALLERAADKPRERTTAWSAFGMSMLVIIREGAEAAVIIAALLAVLKRRKQREQARFVHAGWTTALALGGLLFFFARRLIAGARSEALEGILGLVAAAMLLQAALWLNARTKTRQTMGELRGKADAALEKQSSVALFFISFLAMFRESFETAVFLEALSIDAPTAVIWGCFAGVVALVALVLAISRLGVRLPMASLFRVSTGVLVATAVVLLGQGVHALQKMGWVRAAPVGLTDIPFLGVYGDLVSLALQAGLLLLVFGGLLISRLDLASKDANGVKRGPAERPAP